jgi:SDR family mycofactocin-dependent oxidoreductase
MGKLDGKVVLITGAARGQGRSHAVRLAAEGADVIALDICQQIGSVRYPLATPDDLAVTVKEVEALGRRIVAAHADVRDRSQVRAALEQGLASLGGLDIVCANAGICPSIDETVCSSFIDAMDVDLVGVQNTVAVTLPHLVSGSSIIITGSTAGMMKGTVDAMGSPGGVGYSFAKQLIARYVEVLALQLAPHSIRLNAIHPTNVNTHLLHNEDVYKAFRPDLENPTRQDAELAFPVMQAMPIPYVEPEDVSALVAYLASDESRYMTGLNLRIDAGAMLKAPMF